MASGSTLRAANSRPLATFVSFACCIGAAFGQAAPGLSVDEAVKIGLRDNPQVVAGKASVAAAYATYRSLGAFPPITLGGTQVQGTSTAPTLNGTNNDTFVDLGETFDVSGQRRFQAAGANAQFSSARFSFQETLLTLEQQIRDAYWSLAAAQAQARISDMSLKDAERIHDLTVKQEEAGASPHGDVIRSSIDVANARQALMAARGAERTALIAFNNLLARDPSTPEVLGVDMVASEGDADVQVPSLEELRTRALRDRPLLKSVADLHRVATYAVRQAEASRFPDLGIDYQRSLRTTFDTLLFTISFPLLDFGSISQSVRAAKASAKQAEATEAQTRQQVEQQVAQAHADLELAAESAADYKKQILDPSISLLGMAQLGYQQGATGILPVIDAESTIRNARTGYINSLLAVHKAEDEVLAATGALPQRAGK